MGMTGPPGPCGPGAPGSTGVTRSSAQTARWSTFRAFAGSVALAAASAAGGVTPWREASEPRTPRRFEQQNWLTGIVAPRVGGAATVISAAAARSGTSDFQKTINFSLGTV